MDYIKRVQKAVIELMLLMLQNKQFHHSDLYKEFSYFLEPRNFKNSLNAAWSKSVLLSLWARKNEPWRLSINVGQLLDVEYERV